MALCKVEFVYSVDRNYCGTHRCLTSNFIKFFLHFETYIEMFIYDLNEKYTVISQYA
jgi:hypothetical protein